MVWSSAQLHPISFCEKYITNLFVATLDLSILRAVILFLTMRCLFCILPIWSSVLFRKLFFGLRCCRAGWCPTKYGSGVPVIQWNVSAVVDCRQPVVIGYVPFLDWSTSLVWVEFSQTDQAYSTDEYPYNLKLSKHLSIGRLRKPAYLVDLTISNLKASAFWNLFYWAVIARSSTIWDLYLTVSVYWLYRH